MSRYIVDYDCSLPASPPPRLANESKKKGASKGGFFIGLYALYLPGTSSAVEKTESIARIFGQEPIPILK